MHNYLLKLRSEMYLRLSQLLLIKCLIFLKLYIILRKNANHEFLNLLLIVKGLSTVTCPQISDFSSLSYNVNI